MSEEDLFRALLAFLLGLAAKFIYDIWAERRRRKSLVFSKVVLSSFSISSLEDQLREQTQVLYQGYQVNSIHLVRVRIRNAGYASIKSQAFTVRFGEKAKIIGNPAISGSSEDLRFIEPDLSRTGNERRFIVHLIQKGHEIVFDFAVINHESPNFEIEPGIDLKDAKSMDDTDLDVVPTITGEKIGIDFIQTVTRFVSIALLIPIMYLIRSFLEGLDGSMFSVPYASLWNFVIAIFWLALLRYAYQLIPYAIDWLNGLREFAVGGDYISIGTISSGTGIAVGNSASASLRTSPAEMEALLKKLTGSADPDLDS